MAGHVATVRRSSRAPPERSGVSVSMERPPSDCLKAVGQGPAGQLPPNRPSQIVV